jgi:hypothetical protein
MRSTLRLHKINASDEVGVITVNRYILPSSFALKSGDLRGLDEDTFDCEFFAQLTFPLIAKMCRGEHRHPFGNASIEQFSGDHCRFDCLANANVIRNQEPHRIEPQCHYKRDELVRARCDGYPAK